MGDQVKGLMEDGKRKKEEKEKDLAKCNSPLCRAFTMPASATGYDDVVKKPYSQEGEHAHHHNHESEKAHGHTHGHTHEHMHGHAHGHSHGTMSLALESNEGTEKMLGVLPAILGTLAVITGIILSHNGYASHRLVFFLAIVISGYSVAKAGLLGLLHGNGANIELLTTIASIGAMALGEWAEGALVMTLFSLGEYLEEVAGERSRQSIRNVLDLSPRKAKVRRGGHGVEEISVQDVVPGDIVLVLPGERISADGRVIEGESSCDESHITGEPLPKDKFPGEKVYAGSLNGEGALTIVADKRGTDTTLSRIVSMVEEAQASRAKSQRLVDQFAKVWTPAMIGLGILVSLIIPLVTRQSFHIWIYRGLTLLIVACPCSLVISTPVTVVAAITRAARNGVLIKGGVHLENLGRLRAIAFDKTGTITLGRLKVDDIVSANGFDEKAVLRLAASIESLSEHPLARAIVEEAGFRGVTLDASQGFMSFRGKGTRGTVGGEEVLVGNLGLFEENGWQVSEDIRKSAEDLMNQGKTVVFVGTSGEAIGFLALTDLVAAEAGETIQSILNMQIHVALLTGDNPKTSSYAGTLLRIRDIRAGLLPHEKLDEIKKLQAEYGFVGMVGDGVNDAPSLASATVGIAVAKGADVALETSHVALMARDLKRIPWSIKLSRKAAKLIIENVTFSVGLKAIALVGVFLGILPLWIAVLADSGAALLVTLNGLRILNYRENK